MMAMTLRENALAVLRYQPYEKMPVVHFGFWPETLEKWAQEGHIALSLAKNAWDGTRKETTVTKMLGFDFGWSNNVNNKFSLFPAFRRQVLETTKDGYRKVRNSDGVIVLEKEDTVSIPAEIDHLLTDRASWEKHFKWRLQYSPERIDWKKLERMKDASKRKAPIGLSCGSLIGTIRNILGVEGLSYLLYDDEDLYGEIIDTYANLAYQMIEAILATGAQFDYAHFWEDICYNKGPLVNPEVLREKVAPHYKRITALLEKNGIDIVSLDCDGCIDLLLPIWLENGVNTMFPIEVGTWDASIAPWRQQYGKALRGVGGMNKTVFARDKAAVEAEVERLKPLMALGGYIPCPDHRIAPDAIWENVQYYCELMHKVTF